MNSGVGIPVFALPAVGTPGTYTSPSSITLDSKGRVSAVSTQGNVTFATVTATNVSGFLMAQSAEITLQTILDMTPKTVGQPHFRLQYNSFANAGGGAGTYNHGYFLGYNTDTSDGGTPVSAKPTWFFAMEDNYFDNVGDGLYGAETYIRFVSLDGTSVNTRPFYIRVTDISTNTAKKAVIKFDIGTDSSATGGQFSIWQDTNHLWDVKTNGTSIRTATTYFSTLAVTPSADNIALVTVKNNAASANVGVFDTVNQRFAINPNIALGDTPLKKLHVFYGDMRFESITAPGSLTAALAGLGGSVTAGAHSYKVTYVNNAGETSLGTVSNTVTNDASNTQNNLTAVPIAAAGLQVTARNIYRTKIAGGAWFLLTTLADNTTTTFTDTVADASLGATDMTSRTNTTAGTIWLGFNKVAQLFTSDVSLGAGALANLVSAINVTAVGNSALQNLTTGNADNAFGASAGVLLTIGAQDNMFGTSAGAGLVGGSRNVLMGHSSGNNSGSTPSTANAITSGNDNTHIGHQTGQESATQRSFAITLGSGASVDASNTAAIGGTTATNQVDIASGLTTASAKMHLRRLTAQTSTVTDLLILDHDTSGTVAAGFGTGFRMRGRDNNVAAKEMFYLQTIWNAAGDTTQTADAIFQVFDTAGREFMRARASGTAAMFSLFGATPIIRPVTGGAAATFVANTSGIANDTATWDGYTMGQVVKALRNLGALT